jgi:hypothetical protein
LEAQPERRNSYPERLRVLDFIVEIPEGLGTLTCTQRLVFEKAGNLT